MASPFVRSLKLEEVETELRDGTRVVIRAVTPEDREILRKGFSRLSDESRMRRFMAPVAELPEAQLKYLTEIDYVDHFAWGAVLRDRPDEGIGVARFVRLKEEPEVAEAAITVLDEYQGKGLGMILLGLLAAAAWGVGIRMFRGYVLEENEPVRELLDQLGAQTSYDSPGVLRIDVPLDPANVPDSPAGRILAATGRRLLSPRVRFPF